MSHTMVKRPLQPAGVGQTLRSLVYVVRQDVYVWALAVLALGLRLYHLTHLSLWLDEGWDLMHAQRSLSEIITASVSHLHPPFYNFILHFLVQMTSQPVASRSISAVAGTLSVLLIYALGRELFDVRVGRVAALLVAVAPFHLWWSQEGRPYALVGCVVLVSYLSLTLALKRDQRSWWVVYTVSTALTLYTEYSAFLVLAAQGLVWFTLLRRPQQLKRFTLALVGVVLLYVPWMPILLQSLGIAAQPGVLGHMLSGWLDRWYPTLLDFAGLGSTYQFGPTPPWVQWPAWVSLGIVLVQIVGLGVGVYALRHRLDHLALAGGLFIIPPILLSLLSLRTPMYGSRQLMSAFFGFTLLLAVAVVWLSRRNKTLALASVLLAATLIPHLATLPTYYNGYAKQQWRDLADDLRVGFRPGDVVTYVPILAYPVVNAYFSPKQLGAVEYRFESPTDDVLDQNLGPLVDTTDSVWFVYQQYLNHTNLGTWLTRHGYERIVLRSYWYPLGLELYTRRPRATGPNLLVNGDFKSISGGEPTGWAIAGPHRVENGVLTMAPPANNPGQDAGQPVKVTPRAFYSLTVEYRNDLNGGSQRLFVVSRDAAGKWLDIAPHGAGLELPKSDTWSKVTLAFVTPADAVDSVVILRTTGSGQSWFRNVYVGAW